MEIWNERKEQQNKGLLRLTDAGGVVCVEGAFAMYAVDHGLPGYWIEEDGDVVVWMRDTTETVFEVLLCFMVANYMESEGT